jgi:hypothetical protein
MTHASSPLPFFFLARKVKSQQMNAWPMAKPSPTLLSFMQGAQRRQQVDGVAWGVALDSN